MFDTPHERQRMAALDLKHNYQVETVTVRFDRQEMAPVCIHLEMVSEEPDKTFWLTEDEARLLQGQLTTLLAALEVLDKYSSR